MREPREEARDPPPQRARYPRPLDLRGDIGEGAPEQELRQDQHARARHEGAPRRGDADVARDVAGGVADADHADALADVGLRRPVVVRVQVLAAESLQLGRVQGLVRWPRRHDHRVERRHGAVRKLHLPLRRLARPVERRPDLRHPAPEPDAGRDAEMLGVAHQVAVHVDVIGEGLRGVVEVEVAEARDAARGVDVQRAVGGGAAVVVPVAPHAADLAADLVHGHVEAGFEQVLRGADAAGARADYRDALGPAPVRPGDGRVEAALEDGAGRYTSEMRDT